MAIIAAAGSSLFLMIDPERPSKTRRKQQMHELQSLGERLVRLNAEQLAAVGLPEELGTAVAEFSRLSAREARRRQLQYIGRLMRSIDPKPIRDKLAVWDGISHEHTARLHALERWRERLLEDDGALAQLLREYPSADSQRLRSLIRNARADRDGLKPPKSYRELFRALREVFDAPA